MKIIDAVKNGSLAPSWNPSQVTQVDEQDGNAATQQFFFRPIPGTQRYQSLDLFIYLRSTGEGDISMQWAILTVYYPPLKHQEKMHLKMSSAEVVCCK